MDQGPGTKDGPSTKDGLRTRNQGPRTRLALSPRIVRIRLRVRLPGRGIAAAARMIVAGANRRPRAKLNFPSAYFFHKIRNEKRGGEKKRNRDPEAELGLDSNEQLDGRHVRPPLFTTQPTCPVNAVSRNDVSESQP